MIKKTLAAVFIVAMMSSPSAAEYWEMDLSAGSTNISGGIHYKTYMDTGYLRVGGSGVFTDDDDTEYKWGSLDLTVGSDTIRPGLNFDIGLRGILGEAEKPGVSGDIGAVGFTAGAGYLFSPDAMPVPLEIFGAMTWAPEPLAFSDTESFFQTDLGVGLRIIRNASLIASYSYYHLEMERGSSDWSLSDNVFRAGLVLRF